MFAILVIDEPLSIYHLQKYADVIGKCICNSLNFKFHTLIKIQ